MIYGDTDSVMINSHTHSLPEAQAMAQRYTHIARAFAVSFLFSSFLLPDSRCLLPPTRFKVEVNKLYRLLEIDVDGIFQNMLLLKKKKLVLPWQCIHELQLMCCSLDMRPRLWKCEMVRSHVM